MINTKVGPKTSPIYIHDISFRLFFLCQSKVHAWSPLGRLNPVGPTNHPSVQVRPTTRPTGQRRSVPAWLSGRMEAGEQPPEEQV